MERRQFLSSIATSLAAVMLPSPAVSGSVRQSNAYLRTNWSRDPHSFGSYSFISKSARKSDHRVLAEPIDNKLFFAGEAAHPDYNSTVHAAYESGLIAGENVIRSGARRVAVIGAGISGLAAAWHLANANLSIDVFEARDRIGGRVWTTKLGDTPLDMGASWIHGTEGNPLVNLADSIGLDRVRTGSDGVYRGTGGRKQSERAMPDWLDDIVEIQNEFGTAKQNLNLRAYADDSDYDGDDEIFPRGYSAILAALIGRYSVLLNHSVYAIDHNMDQIVVHHDNGQSDYDAVIVTLPLGVLKAGTVRFSPELPKRKKQAIRRLGMGVLDKLYLRFDRVFWDKDASWIALSDTDLPAGQFNGWFNIAKYIDEPVLLAFNAGDAAIDLSNLSDLELLDRAQSVLSRNYPA